MDLRRLELLVELSRLGSMREVADEMQVSTSTVSQQIAQLGREVGAPLVEPVGRRVRLTPAGRRLAEHSVGILAAAEAARLDLDPEAEPSGLVRVGGFASALRDGLMPVVSELAGTHPLVQVTLAEFEPVEALRLLAGDRLDLVLAYDYNLAPLTWDQAFTATALWTVPWGLAVPSERSGSDLTDWAEQDWIVNSRNPADETAVGVLGSIHGFTPRITHQIDSLDLVEDLVRGGYGVGLIPLHRATGPGVRVDPLPDPGVVLTAYAVTGAGRERWSPLGVLLDRLVTSRARPGEARLTP